MKVHPATQFKNQHRKIEISEEDIPPSQPVGGVGRRTGQIFIDEKEDEGEDFFFNNNHFASLHHFTQPQSGLKHAYKSSSSDSSEESESLSSSSEAEESSIEKESDDSEEEGIDIQKKNNKKNPSVIKEAEKESEDEDEEEDEDHNKNTNNKSILRFKTKEQINQKINKQKTLTTGKNKIDGLSTIKKIGKTSDNSMIEEENILKELNGNKRQSALSRKANNGDSLDLYDSFDMTGIKELKEELDMSSEKKKNKTIEEIPTLGTKDNI